MGVTGLADRLPVGLRAAAVAPSTRALAGIVVVLVLGLLFGGWLVWQGRPEGAAAPARERTTPPTSAAGFPSSAPPTSPGLVVHVAGAVRRPGLVQLPPASRVADAIDAAGGPAKGAELASVNLARPLIDGEQLVVLTKGQGPPVAAPGAGVGAGPGGAAADGVIDLNTATLEQLDTLPGVGPVLAQRILDWRTEHGRFGSIDELREVSGIGDATFADLEARVRT